MSKVFSAAVICTVLLGIVAAAPASAKNVSSPLGDFFYKPEKLTIKSGDTVVWKWPSVAGDPHDVKLSKGPKGVKRFKSELASSDYTYRKKLTKEGKYAIICTLHTIMTQTITVK